MGKKELKSLGGREAGGPGPLEIEATEMTSDVDNFADEEKSRHFCGFHRFAREFGSINASRSDFGLFVTFRGGRDNFPCMDLFFEGCERGVCPGFWRVKFQPAGGKPFGEKLERFVGSSDVACAGLTDCRGNEKFRREI